MAISRRSVLWFIALYKYQYQVPKLSSSGFPTKDTVHKTTAVSNPIDRFIGEIAFIAKSAVK